eukprot:m.85682 g.85682  ORF g.85682 m.85682 type:complete len:59 (-) comp14730_c0_seq1:1851-2027(-)
MSNVHERDSVQRFCQTPSVVHSVTGSKFPSKYQIRLWNAVTLNANRELVVKMAPTNPT